MIRNLPPRAPELGRIRAGTKGPKGEPVRSDTWIVTSNDDVVVKAVASIYGGGVEPWDGGEQTWRVKTESAILEVLLPPDPLFTAYERWGSGGCQRRCDGLQCSMPSEGPDGAHLVEEDCYCQANGLTPGEDVKKGGCDVAVRLKVVMPDVPGLGIFLLTSSSINAAMELPGQVELLHGLRGGLVPASLVLDKREVKKPWEKYKREFIVPSLRVRASLNELSQGSSRLGIEPADEAEARPAIGRAPAEPAQAEDPGRPFEAEAKEPLASGQSAWEKQVMVEARKAGLDDEQRHALTLYAVNKTSTKDLLPLEANKVIDAIKQFKQGFLGLELDENGKSVVTPAS